MAVAQTGKKNTEAFSNHWLHLDISESELTLRQRFQRKSSFNADGVKWRQSWSSCELEEEDDEKNQEGEKDSNGSVKKMYLKKLKKKSMKVFRSFEDEIGSHSGKVETQINQINLITKMVSQLFIFRGQKISC